MKTRRLAAPHAHISEKHKKLLTNFGKTIENSVQPLAGIIFVAMNATVVLVRNFHLFIQRTVYFMALSHFSVHQ